MNWIDWIKNICFDIRDFLLLFFITYFLRVKNQLSSSASKRVS